MNPFIYGGVVKGRDFTNREREIKELETYLMSGRNVLLLSPRKYGKSSLVMNTLDKMRRKGSLCAYINLSRVTSVHRFLGVYLREVILEAEKNKEKASLLFKRMLPRTHADVEIDLDNLLDPGDKDIKEDRIQQAVQEVMAFPQKMALKKRKNFIIAFDEFQVIEELDGESLLQSFKCSVEKNNKVSYFFSRINLGDGPELGRICDRYHIHKVLRLKKIPRARLALYLSQRFEQTGYRLEQGVMDEVLKKANDYPYNAQFLCHELWERKNEKKNIRKNDVNLALQDIIKRQSPFYISLWENLTSRQRNTLRAVARLGGEQIYSKEFARAGGVGSIASLQTSIQLLQKKNILNRTNKRYEFEDVFFREWILTEIN